MSSTLSVRDVCRALRRLRAYGPWLDTLWRTAGRQRRAQPGAKKPRWRITQEALEAFELARTPTPPAPGRDGGNDQQT